VTPRVVALVAAIALAPLALAGTEHDPEIVDPGGDAVVLHSNQDNLDLLAAWIVENSTYASGSFVPTWTIHFKLASLASLTPPVGDDYVGWVLNFSYGGTTFSDFALSTIAGSPQGSAFSILCVDGSQGSSCHYGKIAIRQGTPGYVEVPIASTDAGNPGIGDKLTELVATSITGHGELDQFGLGSQATIDHAGPGRDFVVGANWTSSLAPPSAPAATPSPSPSPSTQAAAVPPPEPEPWWANGETQAILGVVGLAVSGAAAGAAVLAGKRRRRALRDYLAEIERAYDEHKLDPAPGVAELASLRAEIRAKHAKGALDDAHFLELDKLARERLARLRLAELDQRFHDLPTTLLTAIRRLVGDGSMTATDARLIERQAAAMGIAETQRAALVKLASEWARQDAAR
jgi:hypothetical protein